MNGATTAAGGPGGRVVGPRRFQWISIASDGARLADGLWPVVKGRALWHGTASVTEEGSLRITLEAGYSRGFYQNR